MNRRKFVVISTVAMLAITMAVVGLSFYSNFAARASGQGLPNAVHYFPADSHAVFGINVQAFINSPVYAQIAQTHEQEFAVGLDVGDLQPERLAQAQAAAIDQQEKDLETDLAYGGEQTGHIGPGEDQGELLALRAADQVEEPPFHADDMAVEKGDGGAGAPHRRGGVAALALEVKQVLADTGLVERSGVGLRPGGELAQVAQVVFHGAHGERAQGKGLGETRQRWIGGKRGFRSGF